MSFDAILFDAGNTLLFLDPLEVLPVLREVGVESDEDRFWEAEATARLKLARAVKEGADGTEADLWAAYFEDLFRGCGVPEAHLSEVGEILWRRHQERHLWTHVDPGTVPALERLKALGHRLAVISNADGRMEGVIRRTGLGPCFEFVLDSAVEGVAKPDPEIFLRACRRLELEPDACLYVGDLFSVDVLGARRAGLDAVLLDPSGELDFPVDRIPNVAAVPGYLTNRKGRLSRGP